MRRAQKRRRRAFDVLVQLVARAVVHTGKPDIVLPKYKTVVFVNGCFWHHHDCKYFKWPENNAEFWKRKIGENEERDKKNQGKLKELGWNVLVVWECDVKGKKLEDALKELLEMKPIKD